MFPEVNNYLLEYVFIHLAMSYRNRCNPEVVVEILADTAELRLGEIKWPVDSTAIRAEIRFERVVMVWRVLRVVQSRPWLWVVFAPPGRKVLNYPVNVLVAAIGIDAFV